MNDDREPHLRLIDIPQVMSSARVLFFSGPIVKERLFAGWVGCDGNVVPLKTPTRKITLDRPRDDEWI
jgi:hypothetical protein